MDINTDNEKLIDVYIESHPECKMDDKEQVYIKDERNNLEIFRFPLDLVFYNIRNGRFAAEYRELTQKEGRELNTQDKDDAKKIQKLLLEEEKKQTKILEEDLLRFKQKFPGIITHEGYLINGNRRMAVLKKLQEEGKDEFGYIIVARLPKGVSETDVWKIEAGLQLSRQEKLDYGPINTLLKLREGIAAGLTTKQIASSLYGGFTEDEIEHDLDRLKLIELYLEYIEQPKMYSKAKVHEHFIALQDIIEKYKQNGFDGENLLKVQKIAFELIRKGVAMLKICQIRKILEDPNATTNFLTAFEHLPNLNSDQSDEYKEKSEDEVEDEDETSSVITIFNDSIEIAEAAKKREKPIQLLRRALTNLDALNLSSPRLRDNEAKQKISKIVEIVEKLKQILD